MDDSESRLGGGFRARSAAVRARDSRHRRVLLLGIAAALLLSLTPVVGRHLITVVHEPLTGIDHIGAICLIALHHLLSPVHIALHLLVVVGLGFATWDRTLASFRAYRALTLLDSATPKAGDPFWIAALRAHVAPKNLRVVVGLPTPAFTTGWWSPVIFIARELADGPRRLPPDELAAVVAHEGAHAQRRDPLRLSLLRAVAKTLFWLPGLRGLVDDVADEAEIRADDAAASLVGSLNLASALVSLGMWQTALREVGQWDGSQTVEFGSFGWRRMAVTPFVRYDLLERRVKRLAGEDTEYNSRVTRASLMGAVVALTITWASAVVDVHDLPNTAESSVEHAVHCVHRRASALSHLLCRFGATGGTITRGGTDCPHRVEHSLPATPLES